MSKEVKVGDKVKSLVTWLDTKEGNIYTVERHSEEIDGVWLKETGDVLSDDEFEIFETIDNGLIDKQEHYTANGIQPIDLMRQNFTPEAFQGFLEGNIIKYVLRHRRKNGVEDLRKAMTYLTWLIEEEENK